ncbi:Branched-chain amino acid transport protein (AzlD) [Rhodobacteraceae bacterium THAF1]|uniref:AzlD domain-containing protein n=1 Tax=Palleronia sp. THAF1 TaxID=2587842 RepID=UPI000F3D4A18|nr:AzlD domain-containing protein [Palleronia sp. THAF1]QFU09829.1 Branched-chain amino acid transport protein (AzlD) [Palleronia sp. THAF1]VDC17268.1 Branched-chain amino acid transport protein (AzlD) [Rhodobacteraceae bacterium THAF1]
MNASAWEIWGVIAALGAGTFLLRFSFLGLLGDRNLPPLVLRLLRYTPVAVFPGIIAPLVAFPAATDGVFDPARGVAAAVTLGLAVATRNLLLALFGGGAALYLGLWLF